MTRKQFDEYKRAYKKALKMVGGDRYALENEWWIEPDSRLALLATDTEDSMRCVLCMREYKNYTPSTKEDPLGVLYCRTCR